jgi:hypothetical protein
MSDVSRLASKYIRNAERALNDAEAATARDRDACVKNGKVTELLEYARRYLEDGKYYFAENRFDVALTSAAYCEGVLDALRLLGLVKFEWTT